jgi:FtsP/CotA-like multicopper oxidase with cupredoxin domain
MPSSREQLKRAAEHNRRELIRAGFSRRELFRMGLLTGAGFLVAKKGLSATASGGQRLSPPTTPFLQPLPIPPVAQRFAALNPATTDVPNTAAGEARKVAFQRFNQFPPKDFFTLTERAALHSFSRELPPSTIWGFNGITPGPTVVMRYGRPSITRIINRLPGGPVDFGNNQTTTHQHNGHTGSESDGFPGDFFRPGHFYDQHHAMAFAGFVQSPPQGDPAEVMSSLWYHDHRVMFTSQNVYKGLVGSTVFFSDRDSGDETDGHPGALRLPSGPFDVPLALGDKVFDADTGQLFFDLFNLDGILGDKFTVNGQIQPFFQVHPRKYRFRVLNAGPSRFYSLFLTDLNDLGRKNLFQQISTDGNLLPAPITVESITLGVAERTDIVIDFSQFAGKKLIFENRLQQDDGRGPTNNILPAGQGDFVMRFDVVLPNVTDDSRVPAQLIPLPKLPPLGNLPRRTFRFERQNGQWAINQQFFDVDHPAFTVKQGAQEIWTLQNNSGGWQHPIHIHMEELRILTRNGQPPPPNEAGRKDVVRLGFNQEVQLFIQFRDWLGRYPIHCHNVVHEDHAMMARFDVVP